MSLEGRVVSCLRFMGAVDVAEPSSGEGAGSRPWLTQALGRREDVEEVVEDILARPAED